METLREPGISAVGREGCAEDRPRSSKERRAAIALNSRSSADNVLREKNPEKAEEDITSEPKSHVAAMRGEGTQACVISMSG